MTKTLLDHYRCPEEFSSCFSFVGEPSEQAQFFRFGQSTIYGRLTSRLLTEPRRQEVGNLSVDAEVRNSHCLLPFDSDEVAENLYRERYPIKSWLATGPGRSGRQAYYALRSSLPFGVRRYLKRISLRGWEQKAFPFWPVDRTVDIMFEQLLLLAMEARGVSEVPFIWFWPKGYSGCVVMTHDVETSVGLAFCSSLMDLDDRYGMKSSFQIVPESRYAVPARLLQSMRDRGFEINVHDWNHDGLLFSDRNLFLTRVDKINQSAVEWGAQGFRSGALYRNLDWYDRFAVSFDMSVPNVGHLDAQPGGCCTVKPYFIGGLLEIPVTTTQDYMLFHLLRDYSISLWQRQLDLIVESNGLASFIVHPDYIIEERAQQVYMELLSYLSMLSVQKKLWIALPREINRWWRERSAMNLVRGESGWRVEGPGSERACVAYAIRSGERVTYSA